MTTQLLIDADIAIYKATTANEVPINWEGDLWSLHCDIAKVKCDLDDYVNNIKERTNATKVTMCISHQNNFRKLINPQYKLNRKTTRKPVCFVPAKKYVMETYEYEIQPWLEADDVIGILATYDNGDEKIVVSEDKDLLTIPGNHWDIKNQVLWEQDEHTANYLFYKQTLTGDTVDNYQGCPGIGPKKAEKILGECEDFGFDPKHVWNAITSAYKNAGLDEDDALVNARMARILRHGEYVMGEPIYWSPDNESK